MLLDTALSKLFSNHQDVSFDIWEELLVDVFESTAFKEWMKDGHSWQLRIVGAPGCGKTTISALTEQRLRIWYADQNVKIACVYFRRPVTAKYDGFIVALLRNILSQLTRGSQMPDPSMHSDDLEDLRTAIKKSIHLFDHTFLLLDDIDFCCFQIAQLVEQELTDLQVPKLSIMVTSRVPHVYNTNEVYCDAHIDSDMVLVYWYCKNCEAKCDPLKEEFPKVICQACKEEGKGCPTCGLQDALYEPYSHVLYKLHCLEITQFVGRELEIVHGDLGLDSDLEDKPPLSTLGRTLERAKPLLAQRLCNDIADRSDFNVALAKARLEFCFNARSVEDIERVGDRIPDPMLALFEASIDRINNKEFEDRLLGLNALLATSICFDGQPFRELEAWLRSVGFLGQNPTSEPDHNLLRTLHATCGLLSTDYGHGRCVEPYSQFLSAFVRENYNSVLYHERHRIDAFKKQDGTYSSVGDNRVPEQ